MASWDQDDTARLPLSRDLALVYAASVVVAVLMAAASLAGLLLQSRIYPSEALLDAFLPNDVANLLIGLPMLVVSMGLARRGSLAGLLLWMGAIFFALYGYLIYVLAMPLDALTVVYLAVVLASSYALAGLVAGVDGQAVRRRLLGSVPERLAGGVLVGLGGLFSVQASVAVLGALVGEAPVLRTDLALHIADAVISPVWVVGGVLLWRRVGLGYVAGLGLLFQASMLFVGLLVVLVLQPFLTTKPFPLVDVVVVLAMGSICFVPLALFWRGVRSSRRASASA